MLVSEGEHLVLKSYLKDLAQERGFTQFFFLTGETTLLLRLLK